MKPLTSSWIAGYDFNPTTGELTVHTRKGDTYTYAGMDAATVEQFATSKSPGRFFSEKIKPMGVGPTKGKTALGGRSFGDIAGKLK